MLLCYNKRMTIRERLPAYGYGRQDGIDENGDVVCLSGDEMCDLDEDDLLGGVETEIDDKAVESENGVAVSLVDRKLALTALAELYGRKARANGLSKAASLPGVRRVLDTRFPNVDDVASRASNKATVDLAAQEAHYLAMLTKSEELISAGFDPADVETGELLTHVEVRRAIGVTAGAAARKSVLRRVYSPK
jgi:hypothetical protein